MTKILALLFSLIFGCLLWSDWVQAADPYAMCAGCHKTKQVDEAMIKQKGFDHCLKTASEGTKGSKGTMPPMKAKAEEACKAKFGK